MTVQGQQPHSQGDNSDFYATIDFVKYNISGEIVYKWANGDASAGETFVHCQDPVVFSCAANTSIYLTPGLHNISVTLWQVWPVTALANGSLLFLAPGERDVMFVDVC